MTSNTSRDLREARGSEEFQWVTSHVFRKTCATILDQSELSARQIADQLGHAKVSMTQDNYLGRRLTDRRTAEALDIAVGDLTSRTSWVSHVLISTVTPLEGGLTWGFCSSDWTRTSNPAINSRMLCQLSYGGPLVAGTVSRPAMTTLAHVPHAF